MIGLGLAFCLRSSGRTSIDVEDEVVADELDQAIVDEYGQPFLADDGWLDTAYKDELGRVFIDENGGVIL